MKAPGFAYIIGYKEIFKTEIALSKDERLKLISDIPVNILLFEIASLNMRLKPPLELIYNKSLEFQENQLVYFSGEKFETAEPYIIAFEKVKGKLSISDTPIFFGRSLCLFAMQEIILNFPNSVDIKYDITADNWINILKYFSAVNDEITNFKVNIDDQNRKPIENLASGMVFLNELDIVVNPFLVLNRFVYLTQHMRQEDAISEHFNNYFNTIGFTPEKFLYHIINIFIQNQHQETPDHLKHYYKINIEDSEMVQIFSFLTKRRVVVPVHEWDLVEIKKSPIYLESESDFFVLDNGFLIDKIYELFVNDFWFDYMKGKMDIRTYRGIFGIFFEKHCSKVFANAFHFSKHPKIKFGDELKVTINNELIELCDVYYRQNKKLLIGEMKSSGVYSEQMQGFGASLYRGDEDKFYKDFGLTQLAQSILNLRFGPFDFDEKLEVHKRIEIYPVLVLNEKIFKTNFIAAIFQERLNAALENQDLLKFVIMPITLFHVSDLENMQDMISQRKIDIWDLLKANFSKTIIPRPVSITMARTNFHATIPPLDFAMFAGVPPGIRK